LRVCPGFTERCYDADPDNKTSRFAGTSWRIGPSDGLDRRPLLTMEDSRCGQEQDARQPEWAGAGDGRVGAPLAAGRAVPLDAQRDEPAAGSNEKRIRRGGQTRSCIWASSASWVLVDHKARRRPGRNQPSRRCVGNRASPRAVASIAMTRVTADIHLRHARIRDASFTGATPSESFDGIDVRIVESSDKDAARIGANDIGLQVRNNRPDDSRDARESRCTIFNTPRRAVAELLIDLLVL
jgi:hypothetical protein